MFVSDYLFLLVLNGADDTWHSRENVRTSSLMLKIQ